MATFHHDKDLTSSFIRRRKNKPKTLVRSAKLNNSKVVNGTLINDESSNEFVDVTTNDSTLSSPVEVSIDLLDLLPDLENMQLESQTTSSVYKEPILNAESDNSHSKFRVTNCDTTEPTSELKPAFDEGDAGYNSDAEDFRDLHLLKKEHQNAESNINVPVCPSDIINLNLVLQKSVKVSCEKLDLEQFCKLNRYRKISDGTVCLRPISPSPERIESFEVKSDKKRTLTIRNFFNKSAGLSSTGLSPVVSTNSQGLRKSTSNTRPIVIWPLHPKIQSGCDPNTSTNANISNDQPITPAIFNQNIPSISNLNFSSNINAPSSDTSIKDTDIEAGNSLIDSIANNLDLEMLDFSCLENEDNMLELLKDLKSLLGVSADSHETNLPPIKNINGENLDNSDISFAMPNTVFSPSIDGSCVSTPKECSNVNRKKTEPSSVLLINTHHPDLSLESSKLSSQTNSHISPMCHNSNVPLTSTPVVKLSPRLIGSFSQLEYTSKSNEVIDKCKTQSKQTSTTEKKRTLTDIQKEMESFMLSAKPSKPSLAKKVASKTGPVSQNLNIKTLTQQSHKPLISKIITPPKVIENNPSYDLGCSRYNSELDCLFGAGNDDFSFSYEDEPLSSDVVDSSSETALEKSNDDISKSSDKSVLVVSSKRTSDTSIDRGSDRNALGTSSKIVPNDSNKMVSKLSNKISIGSSNKTVVKHLSKQVLKRSSKISLDSSSKTVPKCLNKKVSQNSHKIGFDGSSKIIPEVLNRTPSKSSYKKILDHIKKEKESSPPIEVKDSNFGITNYVVCPVQQEEKCKSKKRSLKCHLKKSPIMKVKIGSYPIKFKNSKGKLHMKRNYKTFLREKATKCKKENVRNNKKKSINSSADDTHLNSKNTSENTQLTCSTKAHNKPSIECTDVTFSNSIPSKLFTDFNANSNSEDHEKENNNMTGNSFASRSGEVQDTVEKNLEPNKNEVQYFSDSKNKFQDFQNSKSKIDSLPVEAIQTIILSEAGMENLLPVTTLTEKEEIQEETEGMEASPDTSLSCSPIYPSKEEIDGSNSSLLSTMNLSENDGTSDIDQLRNKIPQNLKDAQSTNEDVSHLPPFVDDQPIISSDAVEKSQKNFQEELISEKECDTISYDNKKGETEEKHKTPSNLIQPTPESDIVNLNIQSKRTEQNVETLPVQKMIENDTDDKFSTTEEITDPMPTSIAGELDANRDDNKSDSEIKVKRKISSRIQEQGTTSSDMHVTRKISSRIQEQGTASSDVQVKRKINDEIQSDVVAIAKGHGIVNKSIKQIEIEQQLKDQSDEKLPSSSAIASSNIHNDEKNSTQSIETISLTINDKIKSSSHHKVSDLIESNNSMNKQPSQVDDNCTDSVNQLESDLQLSDDSSDHLIIVDEINGNGAGLEDDANENIQNRPNKQKQEKPVSDLHSKIPPKNTKETPSQSNIISTSSASKKTRARTKKHTREKSVEKLKLSCVNKTSDNNQNKGDNSKNWIVSTKSTSQEIKTKNNNTKSDISTDDKNLIQKHITKTAVVKIERLPGDFQLKPATPPVADVSSTAADLPPQNAKVPTRTPRNKIKKRPFSPTENAPSPVTSSSHTNSPVVESVPSVSSSQDKKKKKYSEEDVIKPFKFGWMREVVHRASTGKHLNKQSDVYYFNPEGGKLRSMPEISKYLADHKASGLMIANFTFAKETIYRRPFEQERDAKVKSNMTLSADASKRKDSPSVKKAEASVAKREANTEPESLPAKKARLKITEPKSESSIKGTQVKDSRVKETCVKDINRKDVKETRSKDTPAKDTPAKDTPAKDTPAKDIPAKNASAKDVHLKDVPVKDTQAKDNSRSKSKKIVSSDSSSNVKTKRESIPTIKVKIVKSLSKEKDTAPTSSSTSASGGEIEQDLKQILTSPSDKRTEKKANEVRKKARIKYTPPRKATQSLRNPCTSHCTYALYQNPTINCVECHCLFHPSCIPMLPKYGNYTCSACKQALKEKSKSGVMEVWSSEMDVQLTNNIPLSFLTPDVSIDTTLSSKKEVPSKSVWLSELPPLPPLKKAPERNVPTVITPPNADTNQSQVTSTNTSVSISSALSGSILQSKLQENSSGIKPLTTFVHNTPTSIPVSQTAQPVRLVTAVSGPQLPMYMKGNDQKYTPLSFTIPPHSMVPVPEGLVPCERMATPNRFPVSNVIINQPVLCQQNILYPVYIGKTLPNNTKQTKNMPSVFSAVGNGQFISIPPSLFSANKSVKAIDASGGTRTTFSKTNNQNIATSVQQKSEANPKNSNPKPPTPERRSKRRRKGKRYVDFESGSGSGSDSDDDDDDDDSNSDESSDESSNTSSSKSPPESIKAVACVKPQKTAINGSVLNDSVWLQIFNELSVADWQVVSQVCRSWKTLTSQLCLWKEVSFKGICVRNWAKCTETLKRNGTKTLNLRGIHVMNVEESWQNFLKSIENLENIEHLSFDQIPPKVLEAVADALPLLRSLECCCVTATSKRPDLWETPCQLNFSNIRYLRKLRRLKIRSAGGLISQDATLVLQNLPELRYLSLTTVKVSASDHLNFLSSLQKLVSLEFGDCNTWSKENYIALGELKELRHLRLENGGDFRDNNLPEALKHLKNLEELQLMNFRIPRRLGDALGTLGRIKKLSLWPDMSKQMAEVNYNAFQCAVQAKSVKYFCWGIISADDSIPLLQFLKDPLKIAQPNEANNIEELDYEDLFEKLLEVIPDDAKAEIKCISQTFFKEYCCKQL